MPTSFSSLDADPTGKEASMATPPNIMIVITHDTGRHIGPYDPSVATPNLSRLADEGVLFEEAEGIS
jgi:arylsulfatase A-like enzyme